MIHENPEAQRLFKLYEDIREFDEKTEWSIAKTADVLKHTTLINAASIIHDQAMRLEYGHSRRGD
jgi:hypothetical protein